MNQISENENNENETVGDKASLGGDEAKAETTPAIYRAIGIPSSLRAVAPFLEEAQAHAGGRNLDDSRRRVSISCIDHAFRLLNTIEFQLDEGAKKSLNEFTELRSALVDTMENPDEKLVSIAPAAPGEDRGKKDKTSPEQLLIAEANATLDLAESQLEEGMNEAAARNFHTATVYFRVLESIVPHMSTELHARLQYAASRTRQCSHLLQNFVHEHFEGVKCSDIYDIYTEKRIGKGSYGSVYYCKHKKSGEEFACKVINVNRINSHYLRKLHLEIAIMKEVDHPNIIKLRGVFFGQRTVCLVMELCKGGELFDQLTGQTGNKKGFAEIHGARMLQDMLSAILYLHNHGIVHRDLKLENFLFEDKGTNSPLKLIDFGLSKHFAEHEQMRQVVGSAYYTAPEVLRGAYDQRCDIWSIGVIGYMLLSGCPPFYGSNSDAIHDMILTEEADFTSKRFSHVSSLALDFLQKLLVKDVSRRLTPEEALAHPFIQQVNHTGLNKQMSETSNEVADSLQHFMEMSRFKKLVLETVAFSMSSNQIAQMREEFNSLDRDRSGTISMTELRSALARLGASQEHIENLFHSVDVDGSAEINYNEFVAAAMSKRITIDEERLMLAFETLDLENSGFLTKDTIRKALGEHMTEAELTEMVQEIDLNGDGQIDYMEFVRYWRETMIASKLTPLQRFFKGVKKISSGITAITAMRRGFGMLPSAVGGGVVKVVGGRVTSTADQKADNSPARRSTIKPVPAVRKNAPNSPAIAEDSENHHSSSDQHFRRSTVAAVPAHPPVAGLDSPSTRKGGLESSRSSLGVSPTSRQDK